MHKTADCLIEVHTEELPPKTLLMLAQAFKQQVETRLIEKVLAFENIIFYATPRRLALLITSLAHVQPEQLIEKRGPALKAAYDAAGAPTQACIGFARSVGADVANLTTLQTDQGEWVAYKQTVPGQSIHVILPGLIEAALQHLPVAKRMRWGAGETQFVRPVHSVMMVYGDDIIKGNVLGCEADRITYGHRFLAPTALSIPTASHYASLLQSAGYVVANFADRRAKIQEEAHRVLQDTVDEAARLIASDALLDEVTNLVEWPVALCGQFDAAFLQLPQAVLIASMQDHQRYFPVSDHTGKLLPYFVTISNIPKSQQDPLRVVEGNQRVLRARLADAAFFYAEDKKQPLAERVPVLKNVLFQAKLGTLWDKTERLQKLTVAIAEQLGLDQMHAARAALLAKADLTTQMVSEFPALQGVMGHDYALHDHEDIAVAAALETHYLPRFAGDALPQDKLGQALAIADRMDTLVGLFGIQLLPTGDKDPYGLRRGALGVLRVIIEKEHALDLQFLITHAIQTYQQQGLSFADATLSTALLPFMLERLRGWYQDRGIASDIIAAVFALKLTVPLDIDARIQAVQAFKQTAAAEALSHANKRVSHLLSKHEAESKAALNAALFEHDAEKNLAKLVQAQQTQVAALKEKADYAAVLQHLSALREPLDQFFDDVMVITDDTPRRHNRLRLLADTRALFLQVADIALLQA